MKKQTYYLEIMILLIFITCNIIMDIQNSERLNRITREDGIVENATAIIYFLAAFPLFYLFFTSKSEEKKYFLKTKRNYFFLLLGLLFIFFAGEEISWGQRLLNVETPDYLKDINKQDETNIHNLPFLWGSRKDGSMKFGLARILLSGPGIFAMFCLIYCVLIPLLNKFSTKIKNIFKRLNLPVIPIWIGFTFILNHFICESIESTGLIDGRAIGEIKEANYAVLFFIAAISLLNSFKKSGSLIAP